MEGKLTFIFPEQCKDRVNQYSNILEQYNSSYTLANSEVYFDCSNIGFIRPFGLNLLSSMMAWFLKKDNRVYFKEPLSKYVCKYMASQGFFDEFQIDQDEATHSPRSTSVALRRLDHMDGSYLENITYWLAANASISPNIARDLITINLVELINNVLDHSNSEIGCYISAQAYPNEHRLLLSILDLGVGFLDSLKPFYPDLENDSDAIAMAIEEGVSSKREIELKPRGLGLANISGFVTKRGRLEIISYKGLLWQDENGRIFKKDLSFPLRGTCVNLYIDTEKLHDISGEPVTDIWDY